MKTQKANIMQATSTRTGMDPLADMECPCIGCGQPTNLAAHDITGFCKPCGDALEREEREETL